MANVRNLFYSLWLWGLFFLSPLSPVEAQNFSNQTINAPTTMIDDFEDPSRNAVPPDRTNLWGGHWNTIVSNATISVTYNRPGYAGSQYSAGVTGNMNGNEYLFINEVAHSQSPVGVTNNGEYAYAIFHCPFYFNATPVNVACHGLKGIQFWMKGDGALYQIEVSNQSVTDNNWYGFDFTPPPGIWSFYQIPFEKMTRRKGSSQRDLSKHPDGSDVIGIGFMPLKNGSFAYSLDQISFYGSYVPNCSTPGIVKQVSTPTITPTITATYTFTPWPTATPFPTATPYPTLVPVFKSRPSPTTLPMILSFSQPTFVPISTPTPRPKPKRIRLKPTPTWVWNRTRTATPWPTQTQVLEAAVATPTTVAPVLLNLLDREQTIQFAAPPANIYVTFADGPGWYQLKIVDSQDNLIKTIYDHHVLAESDAWVEWDGQDNKGNDMPPGQYFAVFYKDGTALKSLLVIRSPTNP
jgi:hypothetical protein